MTVFILKINFKLFIKKYLILNKNNDNIKKLYVFFINLAIIINLSIWFILLDYLI